MSSQHPRPTTLASLPRHRARRHPGRDTDSPPRTSTATRPLPRTTPKPVTGRRATTAAGQPSRARTAAATTRRAGDPGRDERSAGSGLMHRRRRVPEPHDAQLHGAGATDGWLPSLSSNGRGHHEVLLTCGTASETSSASATTHGVTCSAARVAGARPADPGPPPHISAIIPLRRVATLRSAALVLGTDRGCARPLRECGARCSPAMGLEFARGPRSSRVLDRARHRVGPPSSCQPQVDHDGVRPAHPGGHPGVPHVI